MKTKPTIIIVNGRDKLVFNKKKIDFQTVIALAFGSYEENKNRIFTVTYKNGVNNEQGSMVVDDKVSIKEKTIFNVTVTDKC